MLEQLRPRVGVTSVKRMRVENRVGIMVDTRRLVCGGTVC